MTFRARLLSGVGAAVAVPLAVLLLGVRAEVEERLNEQFGGRVAAVAAVMQSDLEAEGRALGQQLGVIINDMASDNRFRLARGAQPDRRYVLDYAGLAMRRAGLAMLQAQDSAGRILSSGHFRNQFDQVAPNIARMLSSAAGGTSTAIVRVRVPEGTLLVLARADSVTIGGERLWVTGGTALARGVLRPTGDPDLAVRLELPGDSGAGEAANLGTAAFTFPFVDAPADSAVAATARIVVVQSAAPLRSLQESVDRWIIGAGLVTLALALLLAGWMASRVSQPLRDLAEKTSRIDLDRLDEEFASDAEDEVGSLSRLLGEMTSRLRTSMARLREAERRATVGDLARQLNHDVKNGLVPVRNVFRHLAQVAKEEPARLPAVLLERQPTIEAGISYLENLAKNYARLSPALDRQPCDLNAAVAEVVQGMGAPAPIRLDLQPALAAVAGDPIVIRRILENLVSNAVESLEPGGGAVTVSTSAEGGVVRLIVADEGRGMTERELERAFEDFYTTKPGGTGLGLSIVRRLVLDLHGSMRVETAPGSGTRFIIDLPVSA